MRPVGARHQQVALQAPGVAEERQVGPSPPVETPLQRLHDDGVLEQRPPQGVRSDLAGDLDADEVAR